MHQVNYGSLAVHVAGALGSLRGYGHGDTDAARSLQYVADELMKLHQSERASRGECTLSHYDPNRHVDAVRVIAWMDDRDREGAVHAFTEGLERQIAYRFESASSGEVLAALDHDMPAQELRLHMGELTEGEERAARAAIRWANTRIAALESSGRGFDVEGVIGILEQLKVQTIGSISWRIERNHVIEECISIIKQHATKGAYDRREG